MALEQRARLLGAIWADLGGPGRSIAAGMVPAVLRPRRALAAKPLETYAADLTFCPDGVWRVLRDDVGRHPAASTLHAPLLAVFLPGLCRLLLGQSLLLGSVPVWWLGDAETLRALARGWRRFWLQDGLDPVGRQLSLVGMSVEERARIQAAVDADPGRYIAGLDLASSAPTRRVTCDTARSVFG